MDHEVAASYVAELAAGRAIGEPEAEARAHVAGCGECTHVLETAGRLRAELADHGDALFTSHPDADALVAFAVAAGELETDRLAAIGLHVRACPACGREVDAARAANQELGLRAWLAAIDPTSRRPWLSPALAAGLAILLWPAYLGLVELPRLLRSGAPAPAPVSNTSAPPAVGSSLEGSVPSVLLLAETRGVGASPPLVRVAPAARAVALLVATEPASLPATGPVTATLVDTDGHVAWRSSFDAGSAWDPGHRLVALIVPARGLRDGEWTLRLAASDTAHAGFQARFRVSIGTPTANP